MYCTSTSFSCRETRNKKHCNPLFNIVATTKTTAAQALPKTTHFKCKAHPSELIHLQRSFSLIYAIASLPKFVFVSMEMEKYNTTITQNSQTQIYSLKLSRYIHSKTLMSETRYTQSL